MASGTIKAVVGRSDIVDNLTTNDSTKVLSAAQGKALKDAADTLNSKITTAPVTYTSYADVKSGIASKAATMASGSIASFDFHANYSSAEDLPGAYYTCILRKYDNNSYVADIISNVGADYKLTYAANTWRITSLSSNIATLDIKSNITGIKSGFAVGYAVKAGNVIDIDFYTTAATAVTAWSDDIMTLPYSPKNEAYSLFTTGNVSAIVRTTGKINVNESMTIAAYAHCHITFISG